MVAWGEEGAWELFDMKSDRSETQNLASKFPDKVKELEAAWTAKLTEFQDLAMRDLPKQPEKSQ